MNPFDRLTILYLAAGSIYLLAAVYVFIRRERRPRAAKLMLVYTLLSLAWSGTLVVGRLGWLDFLDVGFVWGIPLYGLVLLAITSYFISRILLHTDSSGRDWLILAGFLAVTLVVLGVSLFSSRTVLEVGNWVFDYRSIYLGACLTGWGIFMVSAVWLTFKILGETSRYYTVATYWGLGLLITLAGDMLFFTGSHAVGSAIRLVGSILAVLVVSAERLPYISHLLRRFLSYLFFSAVAIVIFTITIVVGQIFFQNILGFNLITLGVFLALIFALLLYPLFRLLQHEIENIISGEDHESSYLLRQYSQQITNILDLGVLTSFVMRSVSEFLDVTRGFLFLVDQDKEGDRVNRYQLRGVREISNTNPKPVILSGHSPLAAYFIDTRGPITQSEIDNHSRFRDAPDEENAWLASLAVDVHVPIFVKNEWIGLLSLGPKSTGRSYTDQDLDFLITIADQTAVALENTRLVSGLIRVNNDFRRAYSALEQANRHLERLDRTKSDFISIASHELRTPLTLIHGSSQMLLSDPGLEGNHYYQHLLSKIDRGTGRLHEIVDSMLDVAKIDMSALELETRPVQVQNLIISVHDELKDAYEARKQSIQLDGLDDLPIITADPEALRKVFYHLLVNAIKYTPDGGEIDVTGRKLRVNETDLPDEGLEVVISDQGIGIDPIAQELIFTKFYQTGELALHSSGKTKFKGGGPGLGLAIARGVVEAHHGKIWVESPGHDEKKLPGSKFFVVLPVQKGISAPPPKSDFDFDEILDI